jgi:hypothetical protein
VVPAGVGSGSGGQACESGVAVAGVPAFQRAQTDPVVAGQDGERDLVLDVWSEDLPAPFRVHARPYPGLGDRRGGLVAG